MPPARCTCRRWCAARTAPSRHRADRRAAAGQARRPRPAAAARGQHPMVGGRGGHGLSVPIAPSAGLDSIARMGGRPLPTARLLEDKGRVVVFRSARAAAWRYLAQGGAGLREHAAGRADPLARAAVRALFPRVVTWPSQALDAHAIVDKPQRSAATLAVQFHPTPPRPGRD